MTPKEKAIQLIDNFRLNVLDYEGSGLNLFKAKQCALTAVDEILNTIEQIFETFEERKYWQEVKKEIQKI